MEKENYKSTNKDLHQGRIHFVLSNSYVIYLVAVVFGVIFDLVFPFDFFSNKLFNYFGLVLIIFGSFLVYWAQSTTSETKNENEKNTNFFMRGPYKYTRNPTNFGLAIMALGLGFLVNSFFSVVFIFITYLISRVFFIKKQDSILEKKYGEVFRNYKKKVKDWI